LEKEITILILFPEYKIDSSFFKTNKQKQKKLQNEKVPERLLCTTIKKKIAQQEKIERGEKKRPHAKKRRKN
jgi:hypothetical protein